MKLVFKKIIKNVLLLCFFVIFLLLANETFTFAHVNSDNIIEGKIYSNVSIDDNFDDSSVLVVMKRNVSQVNKVYDESFFGDIGISKIYDLTYIDGGLTEVTSINLNEFTQILQLKLQTRSKQNVINVIRQLEIIDDILWVGPNNYEYNDTQIETDNINVTNGSNYSDQWGLHGFFGIDADKAWEFTKGSSSVRVGIIDSGIYNHSDLLGNISEDGGDFVNMDDIDRNIPGPLREDIDGHGTHIAGIIGGNGNINSGIKGVSPNVELIPLQVMCLDEETNKYVWDHSAIIRAITWCTYKNVDIINFSGGGSDEDIGIRNAINNFQGLFVTSSGNGGDNDYADNNDIIRWYPSDYSRGQSFSDRVISVGAYNQTVFNGQISLEECSFSNYGEQSVTIMAPGESILSTVPLTINSTGYESWPGTSMAAPFVAGTAVLLWSILEQTNTNLSKSDIAKIIKTCIINSAIKDDSQVFNNKCVADGRLNAYNAVKYVLKNYLNDTSNTLNNLSGETSVNKIISSEGTFFTELNGFYKLNILFEKDYEFIVSGSNAIDVILYDEDFNEIEYNDLDSSNNKVEFLKCLSTGTYYLRTKFINSSSSGNISIQIKYTPNLSQGNNNILAGYTNGIEDYVYTNNNSAGFYKITLNATNSSGTIEYPEGCIKVYADEAKQQLLARLETIFYTLNAETQGDSNNVIVFLEYGESYYINIDLPSASYSSMYINIERLTNTYDIIESNNAEEHVILNENTTAYGDYIQRVEIHEAGTYTITFTHEGPQSEENLMGQEDPLYLYYAFYKEIYSPAEQFGDLEMIFPHIASSWGGTISFTFNLQPGVYYIGYYNKLNNEPMTISITS